MANSLKPTLLTVAERYAEFRASIEPQLAAVRPKFDMDSMPSSAARVRGHDRRLQRGGQADETKPHSRVNRNGRGQRKKSHYE